MSRNNPKDKARKEERQIDAILKDADMYEEGMSFNDKLNLAKIIKESRESAEMEAQQTSTQPESEVEGGEEEEEEEVVELSRDHSNSKKPGSVTYDDQEQECLNEDDTSNSSLIVLNSQGNESPPPGVSTREELVTSPFSSEEAIPTGEVITSPFSSEEAIPTGEVITSPFGPEEVIPEMTDDEDESETRDIIVLEGEAKKSEEEEPDPPCALEEEDSSHSFKSVDGREMSLEEFVKHMKKPNMKAQREMEALMRLNILDHKAPEEDSPALYEKWLARKPRKYPRRLPLYYDSTLGISKEEHLELLDRELKHNAINMSKVLRNTLPGPVEPKKWGAPIQQCLLSKLSTLDKPGAQKSLTEMYTLPWGKKPMSLQSGKPLQSIQPQGNLLSLNKPNKFFTTRNPTVVLVPLAAHQRYEDVPLESMDDAGGISDKSVEEDDDEEDVWLPSKKQQTQHQNEAGASRGKGNRGGRGRGRGRGRAGRGGAKSAKNNEATAKLKPALAIKTMKSDPTSSGAVEKVHPALHDPDLQECPICRQSFPSMALLQDHAATCQDFPNQEDASGKTKRCDLCQNEVPVTMHDVHMEKCRAKRRPNLRVTPINTRANQLVSLAKAGTSSSVPTSSVHRASLISMWDDDDDDDNEEDADIETSPPPTKRCRN